MAYGGGQGPYNPNYPPQQGGYPPQQGGYPPQQGGYPQQPVSADGLTYQGVFRPPVISFSGLSFRVAGPGQVSATQQGLAVTGFKQVWPKYVLPLIIVAAVGLIVLVAVLLPQFLAEGASTGSQSRYMLVLLIGPPAVALLPLLRKTDSHDAGQPVQHLIPWSNIAEVKPSEGVMQISVKKHTPSGVIFFEPMGKGSAVATLINRQRQAAGG